MPIRNTRLYETIVDQILQHVLDGTLRPGDRLPAERELAEQFEVSRTAVREAIKALRAKGLVEVRPGSGTFIVDDTTVAVRHALGLSVTISKSKGLGLSDLIEFRAMVEPEIAALSAERATQEDKARLRAAIETMDRSLNHAEAFIKADLDFHLTLASATQNILTANLVEAVMALPVMLELHKTIFTRGGAPLSQQQHKSILQAITDRNEDLSRSAMQEHLAHIVNYGLQPLADGGE